MKPPLHAGPAAAKSETVPVAGIDSFPRSEGAMGQRVRDFDWAATSLGPLAVWPGELRQAVETMLSSMFPQCLVWGPGLVTIYNDGFRLILGDKPEALGRSIADVWSEVWSSIQPIVARAFAGHATFIEDFPLVVNRHGFDEQAYFTFCYSPVRDVHGTVMGMLDTVVETTGKVDALKRLSALAASLEHEVSERTVDRDRMWQRSTDAMVVCARDVLIDSVNPAWTHILGWNEAQAIGRSFLDFVHPDDRPSTRELLASLPEAGPAFTFENRCRCEDGTHRTLVWTTVPDGKLLLVGRDVSAEREAADALRRSETALHQAQKMESVGQLTGGVAHDFNNLLHVISGNLQLLSKTLATDARAERYIVNALAGVQRGAKLASQLLAFARRQPLEPKVVNVARLIPGIEDMLHRTIGEGIEIEAVLSAGLWNCFVDTAQIENAILNLAINARDAMEGVGRLTIEVANAHLDDAYARLHADVTAGQFVMLAVTDTGSGMSAELMQKVFEPFFTTKTEGKGSGLGLSMVYGFVKQSGGHVKLYSEVGHGTTVRIYLPRVLAEEERADLAAPGLILGGAETILVAEDDDAVRGTVVELLTELGYNVLKARDAEGALTVIESGVHVDMLFTDVVMPGTLRTPELARKAREKQPHIAVLFTSGYTQNAIVHGGRLDAGVALISKPYTQEALALKMREVFDRQRLARTRSA